MMIPFVRRMLLSSVAVVLCIYTIYLLKDSGYVSETAKQNAVDIVHNAVQAGAELGGLHQEGETPPPASLPSDSPPSPTPEVESIADNSNEAQPTAVEAEGSSEVSSAETSSTTPISVDKSTDAVNETDHRLTFATFLSGTMINATPGAEDYNSNFWFVAARLLGYQLLHQPDTRTQARIPFIVLVTPDVPRAMRIRLARDGAHVVEIQYVTITEHASRLTPQWRDEMTKLRAWQLEGFDRVLFLDAATIVNECLDGVFDSDESKTIDSKPTKADSKEDLPQRYLLAAIAGPNADEFDTGFMLLRPSEKAFKHYISLSAHQKPKPHRINIFDTEHIDDRTELLNHAHAPDGSMPWQRLNPRWNLHFAHANRGGDNGAVASMQDKWWQAEVGAALQPYYDGLRWRMEGHYEARDQLQQIRISR